MFSFRRSIAAILIASAAAVLPLCVSAEPVQMTDVELLKGVSEVYSTDNSGIIVKVSARGIEGDVVLAVTVDKDGAVETIEVISHNETPALGGKALGEEYLSKFSGLSDETEELDAFSGATVTSDAIKKCVKLAIMQYKSINGIEFTAFESTEEIVEAALTEQLGEGYETIECEKLENVAEVYRSEKGTAMLVERTGHNTETPIRLLVVFGENNKIASVFVVEHAETEGIGTNALKDTYLWYYLGGNDFALIDMGTSIKIDIVSGATETSISVFKMINSACRQLAALA